MSVFAGGACLDAVKGVCGDDAVPDVLGALSAHVDKSLLIPSVPDTGGTPRTSMLRTVRIRAAELLAERGESDVVAARHARWYAQLAEPADFLRHTDCPRFWPVLEVEIDNLRAAARWAIDQADGPLMVDLARRLWMTGRVGELHDAVARNAVDRLRAPPVRRRRTRSSSGRNRNPAKLDRGLGTAAGR